MSARPEVSVVVPTMGRETRLAFLLEALAAQTLAPERFEVVVVRADHPRPKAAAPDGLDVRFLSASPDSGAAEKRNAGWRAAAAPLVVFTDDDCRPQPGWLERLLAAAADEVGEFILQGRTDPDPDEVRRLHGLARSQSIVGPTDWYETCNIAYPRSLLERLGGFDDRFAGGGEDTDLALRARARGARLVYVEAARVWHAVHSRHVWDAVRDQRRWHTIPLLIATHREQRRALELGVFWRPAHPRVLLAVAGMLGALRGRPVWLAAGAPYIRLHLRGYDHSPRGRTRAALDLPARALVDLAGVVATLRAALRHRAPVV